MGSSIHEVSTKVINILGYRRCSELLDCRLHCRTVRWVGIQALESHREEHKDFSCGLSFGEREPGVQQILQRCSFLVCAQESGKKITGMGSHEQLKNHHGEAVDVAFLRHPRHECKLCGIKEFSQGLFQKRVQSRTSNTNIIDTICFDK